MSHLFSAADGIHRRPRGADRDEPETARAPEPEPLPRRALVPESLREALYDPRRPGADLLCRVLRDLRALTPGILPEASPAAPAPDVPAAVTAPEPVPATRERIPEPRPPAGPVLIGLGGEARNAVAGLDGMPARATAGGKPVIHLGWDPCREGESFALGLMTDAYLDALAAVLAEERACRRAARQGSSPRPSFIPRTEEEAATSDS